MRRRTQKWLRKWHRRLGVLVGIQLFFWTLGGTYFAWFPIDDVRGTSDRTPPQKVDLAVITQWYPIDSLISQLSHAVYRVEIRTLLGKPVYLFFKDQDHVTLIDAQTGITLSPISQELAQQIARQDFKHNVPIREVTLVTQKRGEYKGPIPAYRISFDYWKGTNVYVHALSGLVTAHRNSIWRGFDFLWMLHILDFHERENFNNWLLRLASVLGLITILSGYGLWFITRPRGRKHQAS